MKLIDILVQELPKRGGWTDKALVITQDLDGEMCLWEKTNPFCCDGYWEHNSSTGLHEYWCGEYAMSIADDHSTAIITREQYEAALDAKNDGWIEWGGGECPVERGTMVDVRYRNGCECHHVGAGLGADTTGIDPGRCANDWYDDGTDWDIIAYRLHKPQVVTESDDEADLNECIGQDVAPEWNGEGLPPVGCECEMQDGYGYWIAVDIIANKDGFTFGWSYDYRMVFFSDKEDEFRPLRSEADKKREEAIMSLAKAGGAAPFKYGEKLSDGQLLGSMWYELYDAIAAGKVRGVKLED